MDDLRSTIRVLKRRKTSSQHAPPQCKREDDTRLQSRDQDGGGKRFAFTDLLNFKLDECGGMRSSKERLMDHRSHPRSCPDPEDKGKAHRPSPRRKSQKLVLSPKQNDVVTQVLKFKRNVFFTGCAGTGKSAVLFHIKNRVPANQSFFLGPTG
jgi:hypothetical protein